MKIGRNDSQQQPIAPRRTGSSTGTQTVNGASDRASGVRTSRAASAEAVKLSVLGQKLAAARGPEVPDEARIERLRGLVMSGKLPVDPAAITDAILREES